MSERLAAAPPPVSFTLTAQEVDVAAARAGLRAFLSGRSLAGYAQLAAFALFIAFAAILASTGLIGRRSGEALLIGGAIVFMASRLTAHGRLRRARAKSLAAASALQVGGEATVRLDEAAFYVESAGASRRVAFADCNEAENAGGILYFWPRVGEPAFIPTRAFPDEDSARQFLGFIRARIPR